MRTNYVLINDENVQPSSLAGLDVEQFRVIVFVGASPSKLTFDTAAAVQKLGARAEYIKIAAALSRPSCPSAGLDVGFTDAEPSSQPLLGLAVARQLLNVDAKAPAAVADTR